MTDSVSLARRLPSAGLLGFADEVGVGAPVRVVGGKTQWGTGRTFMSSAREVRAPSSIVSVEPAELIIRCGAGTTWEELDAALESEGMLSPLDATQPMATVGGLLSVGESGFRRLRYGHIRDLLLEATYVSAAGELTKTGAPVVKNVSGYDLCRLLVGSLGTLGLIGEVVLRCRPRPEVLTWMCSRAVDPFVVYRSTYQPSCIAWNGDCTYVCFEGSAADVRSRVEGLRTLASDWEESPKPEIPSGRSVARRPKELRNSPNEFSGLRWLVEIGVGIVHLNGVDDQVDNAVRLLTSIELNPCSQQLNKKLKNAFDPTGRLNPGVTP